MKYIKKIIFKYYRKSFVDHTTTGYKGKNFLKINKYLSKQMISFGMKNHKKKIFVIRFSPGGGLFSIFLSVIIILKYIEGKKYTPIIDLENFHTKYNELTKVSNTFNSWEYYFKNLSKIKLDEVYKSKNVIFSENYLDTRKYINLKSLDKFRKIVKKKIKIKRNILNNVNQIYKHKFKNKKIIGLHLRGSDMKITPNHPLPPTLKQTIEIIDNLLLDNYKKIFLVTEEYEYFSNLKKIYKNKLIYLNSFRTKDSKIFSHDNMRVLHRYKLGKEILIETLLLSKCDILVASKTNVILSALIFSSKKKNLVLIDNGINSKNFLFAKFKFEVKKILPSSLFGLKKNIIKLKV